jgi:hypothetical protein
MDDLQDNFFGLLRWDTGFGEWQGVMDFPVHGEVSIGLPLEYADSTDLRKHIQTTWNIIKLDEASFREKAAKELFAKGRYVLFWPEDQPFEPDEFAHKMNLGVITFEPDFPDSALTLGYEYKGGVEHGIDIYLTWNGIYRYAR